MMRSLVMSLALVMGLGTGHALAGGAIAECRIDNLLDGGTLTCGSLSFRVHFASVCLPLKTPDFDGLDYSKRDCASDQRACLTIEGSSAAEVKAFNAVCRNDLAAVASKTASADIASTDQLDTDHRVILERVTVREDLISVRRQDAWCVLQAAGCTYTEYNFHWVRKAGRPLVAEDIFDPTEKNWRAELEGLFEAEIRTEQGVPHVRKFPAASCGVENSGQPERWRFEKGGLSMLIMGKYDCASNTDGGIVTLDWTRLHRLIRRDPLIQLTGPAPEFCKGHDYECLE